MTQEIESALSLQVMDPTTHRWMFVLGDFGNYTVVQASQRIPGLKFRLAKRPQPLEAIMKSKRWLVLADPFPIRRLERNYLLDESSRSLFDVVTTAGLPNNLIKVLHAFLFYMDALMNSVKNLEHPERFD